MQPAKKRAALLTLTLAAIASAAGASRTDVDGEPLRLRHAERAPSRNAALDRPQRAVTYDAAGRPISIVDAMGTVVTQEFDAGNRLVRRTIARGSGVVGPAVEEYEYDGLDRLVLARSGAVGSPEAVTVARTYDSLSRLLSETTNGRTVSYQYDAAGNETSLAYPSGAEVTREFDALARPERVRSGGSPAAAYGYQGPDLVAQKELGNGLSGQMSYDAARRRVETSYQQPGAATPVVGESVSRSPRGQIVSVTRSDEGGSGFVARYDGAGRLAEQGRDPSSFPGNNTLADPLTVAGLPDSSAFHFDAADNLLTKTEETSQVVAVVDLPPDGSHRNRPASIGGTVPVEWDANGNLSRKGDLTFRYDYRNRLTEVATALGPIASYRYDAFNRRIERTLGTEKEETVWSGWQSLETYRDGTLSSRRTYGLGLDEIVKLEQDRDGDGALDEAQVPLYDTSGNLVALTRGTDGTPVEKYAYSPFGEQRIFVDLTRPRIEQLRREGDALLLEVSEKIQLAALAQARENGDLTLTDTSTGQPIEVEVSLPVLTGRTARKRIRIHPTTTIAESTPVRLHLAPKAMLDFFQNPLEAAYDRDLVWSATGSALIEDTAAPQLDLVRIHENVLTVAFTETIDETQATTAITVDGNPVTWAADEDGYGLRTDPPLANGQHRIEIAASLEDLAGTPLGAGFARTVEITPAGALVYVRPDPREISSTAASNPYGFQGLPRDPETGFVYARNRYYDPELGRFISTDPLGYVDGGNLYQYGLNDPVNNGDPLGLAADPASGEEEEEKPILNQLQDWVVQKWNESWLGQKVAAGVAAVDELAGGARERVEKAVRDDFGPTRQMDPFLAELANEAGLDPADLDQGAKLKTEIRETAAEGAGAVAETATREGSYALVGGVVGHSLRLAPSRVGTGSTNRGLSRTPPQWRQRYGPAALRDHHLVPQALMNEAAFVNRMKTLGVRDAQAYIDQRLARLPQAQHAALHEQGWNETWKVWLNQNQDFTLEDLESQVRAMMKEHDIPRASRNFVPSYGSQQ